MGACFLLATAVAQATEPIPLKTLPEPPPEIAALIERGEVTLQTGKRDLPDGSPRQALTGETVFRIDVKYFLRHRWKWDRRGESVSVRVSFSRLRMKLHHTIWLRNPPPPPRFWSSPLVRHEFDHVRISSDPSLATRLARLLSDRSEFMLRPGNGRGGTSAERLNRLVEQQANERAQEALVELESLINIRYRELDRVTENGRRDVPEGSEVSQWLLPDKTAPSRAEQPAGDDASSPTDGERP